jgi:16S rRNA (guanine1516-N2)-methyltransferase
MHTGLLGCDTPAALQEEASQLGLPVWDEAPAGASHALRWHSERLELISLHEKSVVCVDFVTGAAAHRRKFGGGRGQPVAKAVGIKGDYLPRVLDATAGQGRDAFVLASLGCEITLIERSPVAYLLLKNGLARATLDTETEEIAARMTLIHADARQWLLAQIPDCPRFDVIFLDPMFPEPDKRAKSKKEMAAFQTIIGGDEDADALLEPARRLAGKRVIVKRPRHAPHLAGVKPNFVFEGESTRFDGYLPL